MVRLCIRLMHFTLVCQVIIGTAWFKILKRLSTPPPPHAPIIAPSLSLPLSFSSSTYSLFFLKIKKPKFQHGASTAETSFWVHLTVIIERFCSTLSWRRNRTNVASEARPWFSTLSWYVNHVTSGLATVSRRSQFFSHLGRFVVRRDPHLFDLGTRGWEAHTFLCLEEGAKPHPGFLGFSSSCSSATCCKTKTWRSARWQITYVFWHVITYCKTSLIASRASTFQAWILQFR